MAGGAWSSGGTGFRGVAAGRGRQGPRASGAAGVRAPPEWAANYGIGEEQRAAFAAEPRSKVTFQIEPLGQMVRLTVLHDGFEPGSAVLEGVRQGWPAILAGLKTLLETGETLPMPKPAGKAE